jgi:hypothetical protein
MSNYDEKTGISYGVISPHAINPDCLSSLYDDGKDPYYESMKEEINNIVNEMINSTAYTISDDTKSNIIDLIMDDLNDGYENSDGQCDYSDAEYTLHVSGDNFGIFVIKSPYYTYCRKCSPCTPGAGDLNNPLEINDIEVLDNFDRAYCLDKSYFDDEKAPYRVFRVDNDQEVI